MNHTMRTALRRLAVRGTQPDGRTMLALERRGLVIGRDISEEGARVGHVLQLAHIARACAYRLEAVADDTPMGRGDLGLARWALKCCDAYEANPDGPGSAMGRAV